ncbi:hypothetical protein HZS_5072, partial [Henneguya salminicola]
HIKYSGGKKKILRNPLFDIVTFLTHPPPIELLDNHNATNLAKKLSSKHFIIQIKKKMQSKIY